MVNSSDELDIERLKNGEKIQNFIDEDNKYIVGREVEKCRNPNTM
jgi:hypothetical protein